MTQRNHTKKIIKSTEQATTTATVKDTENKHLFLNRHALIQLVNGISTDIDILREQLVGHFVFLQYVVVGARARERGAEEKAEYSGGWRGAGQSGSIGCSCWGE